MALSGRQSGMAFLSKLGKSDIQAFVCLVMQEPLRRALAFHSRFALDRHKSFVEPLSVLVKLR